MKLKEIIQHPQRDGQEVKSLTDSLVSREEEERHQKLLGENEHLKKQIAEVRLDDLLAPELVTPILIRISDSPSHEN